MRETHGSNTELARWFRRIGKPGVFVAGFFVLLLAFELMGWMHLLSRGLSFVILIGAWRTGKGLLAKNAEVVAEGIVVAIVAGFLCAMIPTTFVSKTTTACVLCGMRRLVTKHGSVPSHTGIDVLESVEESSPSKSIAYDYDKAPLPVWFRQHFPNHNDHIWKSLGLHRVEYASVLGFKFPCMQMHGHGRGRHQFLDENSTSRLDAKYADDPEACRAYLRQVSIEFVERRTPRELVVE